MVAAVAEYQFVSVWRLAAPVASVFQALAEPGDWYTRWRGVADTETLTAEAGEAGGANHGVGGRVRCVVRSPLGYSLSFDIERVAAAPPWSLDDRVTGDLEGTGRWELAEVGGHTEVCHTWTVRTTKRWMNALAPLGRPVFVWAHRIVMRDGARALSEGLDAPLLSAESRALRPRHTTWVDWVALGVAAAAVLVGLHRGVGRRRL